MNWKEFDAFFFFWGMFEQDQLMTLTARLWRHSIECRYSNNNFLDGLWTELGFIRTVASVSSAQTCGHSALCRYIPG